MKQAGQEERQVAISKKQACLGDPAITAILDSGWSKRAHKLSYNAKSGVGIIGDTKNIVHGCPQQILCCL